MKKKRVTVSKLKARVWEVFSIYVRLRDCLATTDSMEYGECITCDGHFAFKELQAGHFRPKKGGNYFSERGVHAQCATCNLFGRNGQEKGMPLEYRRQIIKLYGKGVDEELEAEQRQTKKFTIPELEDLLEYYKGKIKEIKGG